MKIRNGFVSNSSASSFIIDDDIIIRNEGQYDSETKITVKKVEEITDRVVKAYNLLMNSNINKGNIMKIGIVDDKLIKEKKEYETEYELINDKYVDTPLTREQIKLIEEQKGKIVIHTKEDNSIPYLLGEMLRALLPTDMWYWN